MQRDARLVVMTVVLLAAGASFGCGYALAGRGSFLPADIQVVGVPPLQNRSTFLQVEEVLTEKLRAELIGRGKYTVVADADPADAVLTGEVTSISVQPTGVNEQQLASRYLFTVLMKVAFTDTRSGDVIWSNEALSFREEYELASRGGTALEGSAFLDQERNSFDRIATDIARTVITSILETF
ncbi:MAG: LPS assembly lipoprotein LptE [Vicinamibacterales bacterium]